MELLRRIGNILLVSSFAENGVRIWMRVARAAGLLVLLAANLGCRKHNAPSDPTAVLDQAEHAVQVEDYDEVDACINQLRNIGPSASVAVLEGLHSTSAYRRRVSIYAAEKLPLRQHEAAIVPLITDEDAEVRVLAMDACVNLKLQSGYAPLKAVIASGGKSAGAAIDDLAKIDVKAVGEAVCIGYSKLNTQSKAMAVSAVAKSPSTVDRATVERLLQLVEADARLKPPARSKLAGELKAVLAAKR
ncbi:MAG: hypothetical protein ACHQ50_05515 [Fimbriimonadales bacterium]